MSPPFYAIQIENQNFKYWYNQRESATKIENQKFHWLIYVEWNKLLFFNYVYSFIKSQHDSPQKKLKKLFLCFIKIHLNSTQFKKKYCLRMINLVGVKKKGSPCKLKTGAITYPHKNQYYDVTCPHKNQYYEE